MAKRAFQVGHISTASFEIDLDVDQVIWAPNGTGKTSLCKEIELQLKDDAMLLDYDACLDSFVEQKQFISFGVQLKSSIKLDQEIDGLKAGLNVKAALARFGLSNATNLRSSFKKKYKSAKACIDELPKIALNREGKELLKQVGPDAKFFVAHRFELAQMTGISEEVESLREAIILHAIQEVNAVAADLPEDVCPICGAPLQLPLAKLLQQKMDRLSNVRSQLVSSYCETGNLADASERLEALSRIAAGDDCSDGAVAAIVLCCGDESKFDETINAAKKLNEKVGRKEKLERQRKEAFERIRKDFQHLEDMFMRRFHAQSVELEEARLALSIKLPRSIETYSTGEKNLMSLMVRVSEFKASDCKYLVVDDPVSSMDLANQYQGALELMDSQIKEMGRHVIIFTHNANLAGIVKNWPNAKFSTQVLERIDGDVVLEPVEDVFSALSAKPLAAAVKGQLFPHGIPYDEYLEILIERDEKLDCAKKTGQSADAEACIFHAFQREESGIFPESSASPSSEQLIHLVETVEVGDFKAATFAQRCVMKVVLMAATRVWVEKNLREIAGYTKEYRTFGQLLKSVRSDARRANDDSLLSLCSQLEGKKVLLNQSVHFAAQAAPFEYALCVSCVDLLQEIQGIKQIFARGLQPECMEVK